MFRLFSNPDLGKRIAIGHKIDKSNSIIDLRSPIDELVDYYIRKYNETSNPDKQNKYKMKLLYLKEILLANDRLDLAIPGSPILGKINGVFGNVRLRTDEVENVRDEFIVGAGKSSLIPQLVNRIEHLEKTGKTWVQQAQRVTPVCMRGFRK